MQEEIKIEMEPKPEKNKVLPNQIDIQDIMNFCFCPVYYKIKREVANNGIKTKYTNAVLSCCYGYLNLAQSGKDNLDYIDILKKRWGVKWIKDQSSSKRDEIVLTQSSIKRDTFNVKRVNGMNALMNFHELFSEGINSLPVIVGKRFKIPYKRFIITGTWDCIVERDEELRMIKIRPETNRFFLMSQIRYDMNITMSYYAFNQIFTTNQNKDLKISLMDLEMNRIINTVRTKQDVVNMWTTIDKALECINKNIIMACPDIKCYHCDVRHLCAKFLDAGDLKVKQIRRGKGEKDNVQR